NVVGPVVEIQLPRLGGTAAKRDYRRQRGGGEPHAQRPGDHEDLLFDVFSLVFGFGQAAPRRPAHQVSRVDSDTNTSDTISMSEEMALTSGLMPMRMAPKI